MPDLNVTLIQTSLIWEDPVANMAAFEGILSQVEESCDLIVLPEMFNTGFTMAARENAEPMEGQTMNWMADVARSKGCVLCGSLIIGEDDRFFNRFVWMRQDGSYETYDKRHLFRMGDEHLHFSAGDEKLIVDLNGWKVMPLICYDLRFPVWSKNTFQDGQYAYDLLIYVANWPRVRIEAWTSLIKGRAIENLCYVAGVNRIGTDGRGYEYSGGSMITAPWGEVLKDVKAGEENIIRYSLKQEDLDEIRNKIGAGNDWDQFTIK